MNSLKDNNCARYVTVFWWVLTIVLISLISLLLIKKGSKIGVRKPRHRQALLVRTNVLPWESNEPATLSPPGWSSESKQRVILCFKVMATKSRLRILLRPHRNLLVERATLTSRAGPKSLPLPTFAAFSGRPLTFWNSTFKSWRSLCSWWTRTRTSHSWFWDCWSNSSKDVPKHSPTISTRTTTTPTSDVSFSLNGRNLRKTILGVITNTIF